MLSAKAGDREKAGQEIEKAIAQKERFLHFHHTAYQIACAYALMYKSERAIYWFRETVNDGFNCYPLFKKDSNLDTLRGDPDFESLMAKELAQYNYYKGKFGMMSPTLNRK